MSENKQAHLPTDAQARKNIPLYSGLVKYFPDALVAVAQLSKAGNDQHNPGQPLHWSRDKSADHEDTILRHLLDSGTVDVDGHLHSTKLAWRALAKLQLELEAIREKENATSQRQVESSNVKEHLNGGKIGQTREAGNCDCILCRRHRQR